MQLPAEDGMITLYGFGNIFPEGRGETKDLWAQWALEETGLPYRVHALDHTAGELDGDAYGRISPFKQVPVIEDDGFVVAESAAIVLYDGREWIACAEFTVADIMMAGELRSIRKTELMKPFPRVKAYYERCQARPAWQRTLTLYAERLGMSVDDLR
jgi:glutathione S-transferase